MTKWVEQLHSSRVLSFMHEKLGETGTDFKQESQVCVTVLAG